MHSLREQTKESVRPSPRGSLSWDSPSSSALAILRRGEAAAAELQAEGDVRFVPLEVTDPASILAARAAIESTTGRLDVLVNNAGIGAAPGSRFKTPEEESAENLRVVFETNVFAVVTVTNAFIPLLLRSEAGRIVNVTSKRGSLGEEGAWVGRPNMTYSSSKTALNAITVHYARSLAATNIKVNGAAPAMSQQTSMAIAERARQRKEHPWRFGWPNWAVMDRPEQSSRTNSS